MNISYMSVLTYKEMTNGEAVAVIFSEKLLKWFTVVVPLGVAVCIFGTTMAIQFAVTRYFCKNYLGFSLIKAINFRLCHVAAQIGHMPELLSYVHLKYLTPYPAVLLQVIKKIYKDNSFIVFAFRVF